MTLTTPSKVLGVVVTAGHRNDSPQLPAVLDRVAVARTGAESPRTRPDLVLADRAYTSRGNRACIPSKTDQDAHRRAEGSLGGRPMTIDPTVYGLRHAVEGGIRRQTRRETIRCLKRYIARQLCPLLTRPST